MRWHLSSDGTIEGYECLALSYRPERQHSNVQHFFVAWQLHKAIVRRTFVRYRQHKPFEFRDNAELKMFTKQQEWPTVYILLKLER